MQSAAQPSSQPRRHPAKVTSLAPAWQAASLPCASNPSVLQDPLLRTAVLAVADEAAATELVTALQTAIARLGAAVKVGGTARGGQPRGERWLQLWVGPVRGRSGMRPQSSPCLSMQRIAWSRVCAPSQLLRLVSSTVPLSQPLSIVSLHVCVLQWLARGLPLNDAPYPVAVSVQPPGGGPTEVVASAPEWGQHIPLPPRWCQQVAAAAAGRGGGVADAAIKVWLYTPMGPAVASISPQQFVSARFSDRLLPLHVEAQPMEHPDKSSYLVPSGKQLRVQLQAAVRQGHPTKGSKESWSDGSGSDDMQVGASSWAVRTCGASVTSIQAKVSWLRVCLQNLTFSHCPAMSASADPSSTAPTCTNVCFLLPLAALAGTSSGSIRSWVSPADGGLGRASGSAGRLGAAPGWQR